MDDDITIVCIYGRITYLLDDLELNVDDKTKIMNIT